MTDEFQIEEVRDRLSNRDLALFQGLEKVRQGRANKIGSRSAIRPPQPLNL